MDIQQFLVTPFMQNCLVVKDGGECIVIDPGEATDELKAAIAGENVTMVFNTHCHIDHAAANAELVRLTGAPLVLHRDELPLLHALDQQGQMFGFSCEPSPEPDRFVEDGETLQVGGVSLKAVLSPGHSPGHMALLGDGFIIGGDVLFEGSIGRTDLPGGDHQTLLESIRDRFLVLPDETKVYCGHGPNTTIGAERATNPFLSAL